MGFKSSSVATAQTTRFKRKLHASPRQNWSYSSNPGTPPATPFNNTSFLIQLQQRRERGRSTPTFDQYGSMESMMIACCSFASSITTTVPASPRLNHPPVSGSGPPTSQASNYLSLSQITGSESPHGVQLLNSAPDGPEICGSRPRQLHSCSDDHATTRPKLEADEEDDVQRHDHHLQYCFMDDDNFECAQCADSGSQTGSPIRSEC